MTDVAAPFGAGRLAVRDGLYRVDSPPRTVVWREKLEIGESFKLDGSEMETVIDIFREAALPGGYLVWVKDPGAPRASSPASPPTVP